MNLFSGEHYSIDQLLSEDNQIYIPDMQRDYCWALTFSELNGKSLVSNFVDDLIAQREAEEPLQMGLLYAYESPANHLQLCDGQQRLTTLFLMLGVLYKLNPSPYLKEKLVLKDKLPLVSRFQYAIRETTLTFLTAVVRNLFLDNAKVNDKPAIKQEDWYFKEYDNDPSIQNMIIAIETVFSKLEHFELEELNKLEQLLLNKVQFLYFDMVNRTYGEEQFVVLNTTGKPLTKTENIKPKLLGGLDDKECYQDERTALQYYADMWEEWELFFWQHKHQKHKTADKGFNEFLRWVYIIESVNLRGSLKSNAKDYSNSQKALASNHYNLQELNDDNIQLLELINSYFNAIKILKDDDYVLRRFLFQKDKLSQIQCFELLPLLSFINDFNLDSLESIEYKRLKQFVKRRAKDGNVSRTTITSTIEAIRIPKILQEHNKASLLNFKLYESSVSTVLLNQCEIYKFGVLNANESNAPEMESAFWEAEEMENTQGDIEYMFEVLNLDLYTPAINFPIAEFQKLKQIVALTFENPRDILRRALLTFGHYYLWHGYTTSLRAHRYTLGGDPKFYGDILNNAKDEQKSLPLQNFLIAAMTKVEQITADDIENFLISCIDDFVVNNSNIYEVVRSRLVKDDDLMSKMNSKLFCIGDDKKFAYVLLKGERVMGKHSYMTVVEPN